MAVPFSHAVSGFGCTPRGLRFIADFWLEEERFGAFLLQYKYKLDPCFCMEVRGLGSNSAFTP